MLFDKEKIVIEIDPDNGNYEMHVSYCNMERMKAVFEDILDRINTGDILNEPDLEITVDE